MSERDAESVLITQAASGSAVALETLLHRTHRKLLNYITRHFPNELKNTLEPLDILQDTWLKATRSIEFFRDDGETESLFRWLASIAQNLLNDQLDYQRAAKRTGITAGKPHGENGIVERLLDELAVHSRTPSRSAASHELMALLAAALQRIPADQAEAVRLRHIDRLGIDEIALRMGRTKVAVMNLCNRGLKWLRWELRTASIYVW